MSKKMSGICRLCGLERRMTFEHVPPRAAYNAQRAESFSIVDWLDRDRGGMDKGRVQQRGNGDYALCADCNNRTGRWYVRELRGWVQRGLSVLRECEDPDSLDADPRPHGITVSFDGVRPLLFLKEIASMLLTINGPQFGGVNAALRGFVLDRERTGLPEHYHFYLTLYQGPAARYVALSGKMNLSTQQALTVTEIAFPPFAYSLVLGESLVGLPTAEISHFASMGHKEERDVVLDLIVGFGHTPLPLDFRSRAAVDSGTDWSHLERIGPQPTGQ